ncbi:DUF2877 domain-containing protein [Paenibacillus albiflavus]|uniref:DUF2877 domain-containing protein n=1 Tax=Paenibacillus albiflavus TaxID=2545760 RepID=A0A4R4ECM3_9BACL|nr:DUF2877 domain-containing protein [Paenibacillus albiflavus]TCZ75698.1 DUF2877 domain-containing protein [Paenibacillus albiflavus]
MRHSIQVEGKFSSAVLPLLHSGEQGYVHSVFQNGWNIRMGAGLIFIGSTKNGKLPFGIHLEDTHVPELISLIKKDEKVLYDISMSSLLFSSFSIQLDPKDAYHSDIGLTIDQQEELLCLLNAFAAELLIHGQPTGAGISVDHFIECFIKEPHASCSDSERKVMQLMDAAQTQDLSQIDKVLRYWIGRGEGLTPSGDDMLAGMLAVDAVTGMFTDTFRLHLSELVEKEVLTTDISREYLKYALNQNFSSVVTGVLNALLQKDTDNLNERTRELLCVGHSSGLDTAFGILIGMLIIRRNSNWHKKL